MYLNLDIWHEILSYLDGPCDKRTLCSLAVTSRDISNLALDTLWWSGGSNQAIVSVINSSSPSPGEPFLLQMEDYEDNTDINGDDGDPSFSSGRMIGSWVLNKPIPSSVCERALEYLARVRGLRVCQNGSPEELVWPILSASLNFPRPLLPNLKILDISFHVYDRNEYLIPLLSPSITTLFIECERPPRLDAISTFLNLAKVRGCDLEDFTYIGAPDHRIPEAITLFNNIQRVWFPLDRPSCPEASITIVQFLRALPSLRLLSCHLGTFSPAADKDQFCHTYLEEIVIRSQPAALLRELFRICFFPSITNATLLSIEPLSLRSFESSCPDTQKLDLDFRALRTPLEFTHLVPLLSLSLQSFSLLVREHTLTTSNLRSFSDAWPNIRFLEISSDTLLDPLPSLAAFSNYPFLNTLNVPLSLIRLLEDIPKEGNLIGADVTRQSSSRSPLRTLSFDDWGHDPLSTADKRVVVEYLLRLFPALAKLRFVGGHFIPEEKLKEFQEICVELGTGVEVFFDL